MTTSRKLNGRPLTHIAGTRLQSVGTAKTETICGASCAKARFSTAVGRLLVWDVLRLTYVYR